MHLFTVKIEKVIIFIHGRASKEQGIELRQEVIIKKPYFSTSIKSCVKYDSFLTPRLS